MTCVLNAELPAELARVLELVRWEYIERLGPLAIPAPKCPLLGFRECCDCRVSFRLISYASFLIRLMAKFCLSMKFMLIRMRLNIRRQETRETTSVYLMR